MIHETVKLNVDYKAAGLCGDGCDPELVVYAQSPSREILKKDFPALIVCPGGGYDYLSDRENEPVALRFSGHGIAVFILKYSCVRKKFPTNVLEAAAAVKYVRDNALKYCVDPDKIFVMGFSAGGHLAACISNFYNKDFIKAPLGVTSDEIKPNGCILCYPVITSGEFSHESSIANLVCGDTTGEIKELVSLENQVSRDTVPTFIWHTADDGAVPVENSLMYMSALSEHKIPFESHIYEWGGHGLSLCNEQTASGDYHIMPVNSEWVGHCISWIKRQ